MVPHFPIALIMLVHRSATLLNYSVIKNLDLFAELILVDNTADQYFKKHPTLLLAQVNPKPQLKIIAHPQPITDFAKVRNQAIDQATQNWVMFLDSDEVISHKLILKLKNIFAPATKTQNYKLHNKFRHQQLNGFYIRRIDLFHGRKLTHGEVGHVKKLRLARRNSYRFQRPIHEVGQVTGQVGYIQEPIYHLAHQSISSFWEKITKYAYLEAACRKVPSQFVLISALVMFPVGKFLLNYIFKLGFLDGYPGLVYAVMMSCHSLIVRARLLEIKLNGKPVCD